MTQTTKEIRVANVNTLIEGYESLREFAEAIDRAPAVASQVKGGRIGERMARHIEEKLNLERGYLDIPHEGDEDPFDQLLSRVSNLYHLQQLTPIERRLLNGFRDLDARKQKLAVEMVCGLV